MHIGRADGELFAFAGLWLPGPRDGLPSATILTGAPNELVASIHNRMPVILRPEAEAAWLRGGPSEPLAPYPSELMRAYEVAPLVNSHLNDGPELLEPAAAIQLRLD